MKQVLRYVAMVGVLGAIQGMDICLADGKIAVVQMDRIVRAYPEAQRAEETLKAVKEEYEKELDKMEVKGKELQSTFEAAAADVRDKAISESEREKRYEIAQQHAKALQEFQIKMRQQRGDNQRDLADQEMRLFKRVIGKLRDVIGEYAKDKKIDVVLDTAGVGMHGGPLVLYASDAIDVTDDILKRIEVSGDKPEGPGKKAESKK